MWEELVDVSTFDEQMGRIRLATGKRTQAELADFLGIRQSSISDARRRGKIPPGWLVTLVRLQNVHPEWVLTGKGACYAFVPLESSEADGPADRAAAAALRRLPARMLADELVRRIAVAQHPAHGSKTGEEAW